MIINIESEVIKKMFVISTLEAILTNLLLSDDIVVITSYEDLFGQEMLVYKNK